MFWFWALWLCWYSLLGFVLIANENWNYLLFFIYSFDCEFIVLKVWIKTMELALWMMIYHGNCVTVNLTILSSHRNWNFQKLFVLFLGFLGLPPPPPRPFFSLLKCTIYCANSSLEIGIILANEGHLNKIWKKKTDHDANSKEFWGKTIANTKRFKNSGLVLMCGILGIFHRLL